MSGKSLHILLADDEDPMRQALTFILESAGHRVTAVDDGAYALQQLMTPPDNGDGYDLLITDLIMPKMPGLDLITFLSQRNIAMPVIVISGCNDKQTMIQLIRRGCNDFLEKPFSPQEVIERVQEVMRKWREVQLKQQEREEALQEQLSHLRRLLNGYEKQLSGVLHPGTATKTQPDVPQAAVMDLTALPLEVLERQDAAADQTEGWNTEVMVERVQQERDGIGASAPGRPPLVETVRQEDWLVLTPQEYLSDDYTPEFCKILVAHLDAGESRFRFDLSRLTEVGSRVLAVFAAFAAVLRQRGEAASLEIAACSSEVSQLFRLTSLDKIYHLPVLMDAGK